MRRGAEGEGGQNQENGGRGGGSPGTDTPLAAPGSDQRFENQQEQGESERPLESFDGGTLQLRRDFFFRDGADSRFKNLLETVARRAQIHVKPPGFLGDRLKGVRIEFALDDPSVLVADVLGRPRSRAHGNGRALGRSHPDGVNRYPVFGGFAGLCDAASLQVFAVRDENQDFEIIVGREGGFRLLEGGGQIRAPRRDYVRIDRIERLEEGVVVERERALQERASRKGDQSDAVSLEPVDEVFDRQFRPDEAVGFDIVRKHGPRTVEGEDQIDAPAAAFGPGMSPLRAGEGEKKQGCGYDEKRILEPFPRRAVGFEEVGNETPRCEAADTRASPAAVDPEKQDQQNDRNRKQEEPESVCEFNHRCYPGSARKRVLARRSSRESRPTPIRRGQKKSSSYSA